MKVLYYNVFLVPNLIEKKIWSVDKYLSKQFNENLFKSYRKYGMDTQNFVYDRTDTIPHYINIKKNIAPIPSADRFNKSFEEVVEEREIGRAHV